MKGIMVTIGTLGAVLCALFSFLYNDSIGQFASSICVMGVIILGMLWWDSRNTMAALTLQIETIAQEHEDGNRAIGFVGTDNYDD